MWTLWARLPEPLLPALSWVSRPISPVQGAVLDGLGDMLTLDLRNTFEVSDRTSHLEDAVMGARAEPLLLHGALQQALAIGRKLAEGADLLAAHLRVAIDTLTRGGEAIELDLARANYALPHLG